MTEEDTSNKIADALKINPTTIERRLTAFIKKKVKEAGANGVVIGLSGGMDSSVAAFLCVKALGAKKVIGISMPEANVTDPHDVSDAREVAEKLGIDFRVIDITPAVECIRRNVGNYKSGATLANANIKPRIRMVILYYYANLMNRLVVGTSNRSELRTGYFTKYGDGASDMLPLGSLYKTQVRQLAAHLKIPKRITDKIPTAGLWKGQTDEGELGIQYEKLDMILAGLDLGLKPKTIAASVGVQISKVKLFVERERKTLHKLRTPDIPKL